ncbi:MAG: molybdopterin molybdotransferase MoeA [Acidimicrobiales bacterium]
MISLDEALSRVLHGCAPLGARRVPVGEALGLVTASPIDCSVEIPPFANTAMDGFAVVAADTRGATEQAPVVLDVVGTVAAGAPGDVPVSSGSAVRIMTGAPIPPGADAVVMVERCRPLDDGARVEVLVEVETGNHVRPAGDDLRPGDRVIDAGTALTAGHLGLVAGLGLAEVDVVARPVVGVMSTGDELVEGPSELRRGQIRDSNRATLLGLVSEVGCVPVDLGIVRDTEDAIRAALVAAVDRCDAVVTTGGVSMGDFDYVKVVLDEIGDMDWMQVAIKPAKPLAFGTVDGTPVFGLPGNPVSCMVSFELFARPGLRRLMGHHTTGRPIATAVAPQGIARRADGKTHFVRVRLDTAADGRLHAVVAGGQGSHQLTAMAAAGGLAVVPDGAGIAAGDAVEVVVLGDLSPRIGS